MTGTDPARRVTATPAARRAIASLLASEGPIMFIQSAGCCGGTAPMCFRRGEFLLGPGDVLLGDVGGCPYYIDAQLDAGWGRPQLVLDVEPGFAEGFSLPAGAGKHFVVRAVAAAGPRKGTR
jgi:uncharacterized protein (DUF779 family)